MISKGDLVYVEWVDAQHVSGSWKETDDPVPPMVVQTVGWVMAETRDDWQIAAQREPLLGSVRCLNVIPRGDVRKMRKLR